MPNSENIIFVDDFAITCPVAHESKVRLMVAEAYKQPGDATRNALWALEDAGYPVELDGAFHVDHKGNPLDYCAPGNQEFLIV